MDTTTADVFEIRLTGAGINPATTELSDLIEVLEAIRDSILPFIPTQDERGGNSIRLGLFKIRDKSTDLAFVSAAPLEAKHGFRRLTKAIKEGDLGSLPQDTEDGAKSILAFVKKRGCEARFYASARARTPLAVITPASEFISKPQASGRTELYAQVERVGGVDPKVTLRLDNGTKIICTARTSIVRDLGKRLYTRVGVAGEARWTTPEFELSRFRIDEVLDYEDASLSEAFQHLHDAAPSWDDVDVGEFMKEMRGDEG